MLATELKNHPDNPREISDEAYQRLVKKIQYKNYMKLKPIVHKDGLIYAGNQRYRVITENLKLKEIPDEWVIDAGDDFTEAELIEFMVLDNKNDGEYVPDLVLKLVDEKKLLEWGIELDFKLIDIPPEETEGDDDVPQSAPPITVKGDLYELGEHRLLCGDSTMIDDVERLMDGQAPDLIHTDPPYGMNAVSKSGVLSKNYDGDILGDDNPDVAKDSFALIYGMYSKSNQIWWGANYYSSVLPDSECWLVWDKNNGESDQTDCELAWANFRSVVRQFTQSSEKVNRVHPTQKPVSLVEWIIKRFKLTSKTILDVFGGSGTTLIAAEKHNIIGYIMELDEKYCDVIVKRYVEFCKKNDKEYSVKRNGAICNDFG